MDEDRMTPGDPGGPAGGTPVAGDGVDAGVAPLVPPFDPDPPKRYDAFISYSHSGDGDLAPAVQAGLQKLAKPLLARRALEVFRDGTGLSVSPELWGSICRAMDGASHLVLFASPPAARSRWVGLEIERWVATKGSDTILPVVTDGTWVWDDATGDLDLARSTAVHPSLAGVFANEPRPLFLERTGDPGRLNLKDDAFRDAIAELAAPIHGVAKDDLESDEVRAQRRVRRLARGALSGLVLLTLTSVLGAVLAVANQREAVAQRDVAETEARVTRSQVLANEAINGRDAAPDLRLLLAAHAAALEPTDAATNALLNALLDERDTTALLPGHVGGAIQVDFSADDEHVVTVDAAGQVRVWHVSGSLRGGPIDAQAVHARLDAAGSQVVTIDRLGTVSWFGVDDGELVGSVEAGDRELSTLCSGWACDLPIVAVHPSGERVLLGTADGHVRTVWRDGRIDDLPAGAQVTGLLFGGDGDLYVSTVEAVRAWDADGPRSDLPPVHTWVTGSALLPNLVASDRGGEELTIVDPGMGELNLLRRFDTSTRTWVEAGTVNLTATDRDGSAVGERIGAIAMEDLGVSRRLLVGTEPRGFEARTPQLLAFDEQGNRTVLTEQLGRPMGAVNDLAVHPLGLIAVASRSEVVRISASTMGEGRGVVTIKSGPIRGAFEPSAVPDEMRELAGPTIAGVTDLGEGRYATIEATRRSIAELEQEAIGAGARVVAGTVRVVDGEGQDSTPSSLREIGEVTAVAGSGGDLLVTGDRYGRVRITSLSRDHTVERRISSAPIVAVVPSPDERWMLVLTSEEVLLAAVDGSGARALVTADGVPNRRGAAPLYSAFSVAGVLAGWADDGGLLLGWDAQTSERAPSTGQSPFPELEVRDVVVPTLPGVPVSGAFSGGEVHVRIDVDDLLERACRLANRELSRAEREFHLGDPDAPAACPDQRAATGDVVPLLTWIADGGDGEADIVLRDELPPPSDTPDAPPPPPPPPPPVDSGDDPLTDLGSGDGGELGRSPFPDTDPTSPIAGAPAIPAVGDCLFLDPDLVAVDGLDWSMETGQFTLVPCTEVHSVEVMAAFDGERPCGGEVFRDYVGTDEQDSLWTATGSWFYPLVSADQYLCLAVDGSVAASGFTDLDLLPSVPARASGG